MKNSKKILVVAMSIIMIIATTIPLLAASANGVILNSIPDDIGTQIETISDRSGNLKKYYIMIYKKNNDAMFNYNYTINYYLSTIETVSSDALVIQKTNSTYIRYSPYNIQSNYSIFLTPYVGYTITNTGTLYIPVYIRNCTLDIVPVSNDIVDIYLYESTSDDNTIASESFQLGYDIGYYEGYQDGLPDGAGFRQDLNLVEHCEQLLGTFVGDDYAHYITPLCLALVVILIYFLFIRWLLALVKSKNVTRVADIIVCTACIIMLVIMYAPMLDLTIKQAQTVYQIAADTVVGG